MSFNIVLSLKNFNLSIDHLKKMIKKILFLEETKKELVKNFKKTYNIMSSKIN
jgi:uncharacterized protein (UPF0335 family)